MKMLLILCLPLFLVACSGEKTAQEHVHETATDTVEAVDEAASDLRQEACEMVDGKLECAVERAEREVEDAVQ